MKVSILVPIYNVEKYIERCAHSLFKQTYSDIEYVFVDDDSPDNSIYLIEKILKEYPHRSKAVRIIHHEKNRGVSVARNTAVTHCSGDFLMFVDGDDYLEEDAVSTLVSLQESVDADIVNGVCFMEYDDVRETIPIREYQDGKQMAEDMIEITLRHALWGKLMRRSIFIDNDIRAQEGANVSEDMLMITLFAYYSQKIINCYKPVYHYNCGNVNSCLHSIHDIEDICRKEEQDMNSYLWVMNYFEGRDKDLSDKAASAVAYFAAQLMIHYIDLARRQDLLRIYRIYKRLNVKFTPTVLRERLYAKMSYNYWSCRAICWMYKMVGK